MRPVLKFATPQYNAAEYDVMRLYLFESLGPYCSYCEQPVSNDTAVEHKIPKSENKGFQEFQYQWRNLLLACHTCNSAKGARPHRYDVPGANEGWVETHLPESWYQETLKLWVWPDLVTPAPRTYTIGSESMRLFRPVRDRRSQDDLGAAGLIKEHKRTSASAVKHDMTWIVPNDTHINDYEPGLRSEIRARVVRTIVGLNLNRYEPDEPKLNDRRVSNRTAAHDAALAAISRLGAVCKAAHFAMIAPEVRLAVQAVRETAVATGFWSLWFRVFFDALHNPQPPSTWAGVDLAKRKDLLEHALVHYYDGERKAVADQRNAVLDRRIFPGTDIGRLPLDIMR